jgi:ryanodine receptor 2
MADRCSDLTTCLAFHLNYGLRAGGGIGDELESAEGHDLERYRFLFDMSFFFFVVTILLAVVQVRLLCFCVQLICPD